MDTARGEVMGSEMQIMREHKREHGVPDKIDDGPLYADGFDAALIGHTTTQGGVQVAVYDYGERVDVLMEEEELTWEDAIEHMEFNVTGAYVGPRTPIFYYFADEEE